MIKKVVKTAYPQDAVFYKSNGTYCPEFVEICRMDVPTLKEHLTKTLVNNGYRVYSADKWVFALGSDVLLTAHMDTVHKELVDEIVEYEKDGKHFITSPQGIGGDDRCGIYMILKVIENGYRPTILFCDEEEIGGIGSREFVSQAEDIEEIQDVMKSIRFMVELDRANSMDAVYYSCANPDFVQFIDETISYKEAFGSFSDIENLMRPYGVAGVNLSCGYYKQHTLDEYVIVEEMMNTLQKTMYLLDSESTQFEYIEDYFGGTGEYYGFIDPYESQYFDVGDVILEIEFPSKKDIYDYDVISGKTESEAIGRFLMDHPDLCYEDIYIVDMYHW